MPVRILIADDNQKVREMLKILLEAQRGWRVCGEAANGLEAVQKAAELSPDVIILDVSMPKMDGFQTASLVSSASPNIPILIFTHLAVPPGGKIEAKEHGVLEIIYKEAPDRLISAVATVLQKEIRSALDETLSSKADTTFPEADVQSDIK